MLRNVSVWLRGRKFPTLVREIRRSGEHCHKQTSVFGVGVLFAKFDVPVGEGFLTLKIQGVALPWSASPITDVDHTCT